MMSTQFAARRWTYEEFAKLPDDGNRYEVIGGELYVTPAAAPLHQKIVARLTRLLDEFGEKYGRVNPSRPSTCSSRRETTSSPTSCSFAASTWTR
jgi:Uma2 family endonuclease